MAAELPRKKNKPRVGSGQADGTQTRRPKPKRRPAKPASQPDPRQITIFDYAARIGVPLLPDKPCECSA